MSCMRCRWCTTSAPRSRGARSTGSSSPASRRWCGGCDGIDDGHRVRAAALERRWWTRRGARRVARVPRAAAARALRRGARPAGPDQIGAGRAAGARAAATAWPTAPTARATSGRRAGWSTTPIRVEPHIHALDRSRVLAAQALGYAAAAAAGVRPARAAPAARAARCAPTLRASCTAPRATTSSGPRPTGSNSAGALIAEGWRIALPHAGAVERGRARSASPRRSARAPQVWPAMGLDALVDRLAASAGRDRRRQRPEPHRRRARSAARADLQLPDRVAHRAAGRRTATGTRCRSRRSRRRRSKRSGAPGRRFACARGRAMSTRGRAARRAGRCTRRCCCAAAAGSTRCGCGGAAGPSRSTATRIGERFGRYGSRRSAGWLWVHAVSLGETRAAAALVDALRARAARACACC